MAREGLGEFEHKMLLAILRLGEDVYSVPVVLELERCTGKTVSPAAVHIALRRLEKRGLIRSKLEPPTTEIPRPRRYVVLTEPGVALVRESREALELLWEGLDPVFDR